MWRYLALALLVGTITTGGKARAQGEAPFRIDIKRALMDSLDTAMERGVFADAGEIKLSRDEAIRMARSVVRVIGTELLNKASVSEKPGIADLQKRMLASIVMAEDRISDLVAVPNGIGSAVEAYVENLLLGFTGNTVSALQSDSTLLKTNPLSDYRLLIGGTWSHPENGGLKGIVTASLLLRTRWLDVRGSRGKNVPEDQKWKSRRIDNSELGRLNEGFFLDLLVNAHFITNQPFNKELFSPIKPDSLTDVLLTTATSSRLSAGLFLGPPFRLADWATIGPTVGFSISSQEGTSDIFRRLTWGLRFENRSDSILREAAIDVAFTKNQSAGSRVSALKKESVRFGKERLLIDLELPVRSRVTGRSFGLYFQFHGEWPIVNPARNTVTDTSGKVVGEKAPPVYQFRMGATFDPLKLFGPLFGMPL